MVRRARERSDGQCPQPGKEVLTERDLSDEAGQQVERQDKHCRNRRQGRKRTVVVCKHRGDRSRQDDGCPNRYPSCYGRVHTVLLVEKPGLKRIASVPRTRMKLTSAPTPAPLKKARGYVCAI